MKKLMKTLKHRDRTVPLLITCAAIASLFCHSAFAAPAVTSQDEKTLKEFKVSQPDAEKYIAKVDELVSKNFYSEIVVRTVWTKTLQAASASILQSRTLKELGVRLNQPLNALEASHTQFITENDELFYFLHSMFGSMNEKISNPKMDFIGITTGGAGKSFNCIRYVLDGSPGAKAGLQRDDLIKSVDGREYIGQMSFYGRSNSPVELTILRAGKETKIVVTPKLEFDYPQYAKAIQESINVFPSTVGRLGYVRYWSGGGLSHVAFEHAVLSDRILNTEGLIVDLRDGYGGNSSEDFDVLFRPQAGYAKFKSVDRSHKEVVDQSYYDKPVVVLINRGSRSGKELLAYNIKKSGRGTLVGETTAGFFLGGRLFPIDRRASLYLAVIDAYLDDNVRLEKVGVSPDIVVPDDAEHPEGFNDQLVAARKTLVELIEKKKSSQKPAPGGP